MFIAAMFLFITFAVTLILVARLAGITSGGGLRTALSISSGVLP